MSERPPHVGRWKRTATMILLLLAGGAVVNVAVAWGLAAWTSQDSWTGEVDRDAPKMWPPYLQRLEWPVPSTATERNISAIGVRVIDIVGGDPEATWRRSGPGSDKIWVLLEVRQFGIPAPALLWESHGVRAGPRGREMAIAAQEAAGLRGGIDISTRQGDGSIVLRSLPLVPVFPGFIINTLVYSLLLWLLFAAPFTARRMLRRRRGLCAKCAYPVGVSPVCTECGAAIAHKARA